VREGLSCSWQRWLRRFADVRAGLARRRRRCVLRGHAPSLTPRRRRRRALAGALAAAPTPQEWAAWARGGYWWPTLLRCWSGLLVAPLSAKSLASGGGLNLLTCVARAWDLASRCWSRRR
jgi:hypothetical protein